MEFVHIAVTALRSRSCSWGSREPRPCFLHSVGLVALAAFLLPQHRRPCLHGHQQPPSWTASHSLMTRMICRCFLSPACVIWTCFFFSTAHCVPQHICRVHPLLKIFTASERWRAEDVKCWRRKEKKSAQRERGIPFTLYQCVYHLSFLCLSEDYIQIAQIKAERDKKWKKDKQRHSELFFSRELRELGTIVHLQLSEQVAWLEVWARSPSVKMDTRADLARNCSLSQAQEITGEHWLSTANEGISWKRAAAWGSQVDLVILDVSTPSQSLQKH